MNPGVSWQPVEPSSSSVNDRRGGRRCSGNLASRNGQRGELQSQRDKLRMISVQVQAQLGEGMVSQLEVLEAERSVLAAEQQLLANKQQILSDTVALYKALGGGWPEEYVGTEERAAAQ